MLKVGMATAVLIATPTFASPKAVECDVLERRKEVNVGQNTAPVPNVRKTLIYVIDDAEKTLSLYDPEARALSSPCQPPKCSLKYGAAKISYAQLLDGPGYGHFTFELDREQSTVKDNFFSMNSATLSSITWTKEGVCKPTAMPPLKSDKAKF